MIRDLFISVRALLVLTLLTGIAYPLMITGVAQALLPQTANGSLLRQGDQLEGSALLAQKFTDPRNFWPRPSAADYGTVASGASNQGFTSQKLIDAVAARRAVFGGDAPADLLLASGSGLDPHISPAAAQYQVARVAGARNLPPARVAELVTRFTEAPQFGFLGEPRVNVLLLNRALNGVE